MIRVFALLNAPLICMLGVFATTHWYATEDGRIRPLADSVFHLRNPDNLFEFLRQSELLEQIKKLHEELSVQKKVIDAQKDEDEDVEATVLATEPECLKMDKPLQDQELAPSLALPLKDYGFVLSDVIAASGIDMDIPEHGGFDEAPLCDYPIPSSMKTFEHLEGIQDRDQLMMDVEAPLLSNLFNDATNAIAQFAPITIRLLEKRPEAWEGYLLATLYWRIEGEASKAIECARRALYFATEKRAKILVLHHMGYILHRARQHLDALILFHAAHDLAPTDDIILASMGYGYALIGEANASAQYFKRALRYNPDKSEYRLMYYSAVCFAKVEKALQDLHGSLQNTLTELRDYQSRHQLWMKTQEELVQVQATREMKAESQMVYEEAKIRADPNGGLGDHCIQYMMNERVFVSCGMPKQKDNDDYAGSVSHLLKESERFDLADHLQLLENKWGHAARQGNSSPPSKLTSHSTTKQSTAESEGRDDTPHRQQPARSAATQRHLLPWPSAEECVDFPENGLRNIIFYVGPERFGLNISVEVSRLSGVELLETLDVCQTPEELQSFTDAQRWKAIVNELPEEMLLDLREREQMIREVLLDFSPSRDLDDAFRRIATARSKKFQPDWIWDFMAGIAWRTQGHVKRSLHCLLQAASKCPEFFRRIPLASIGNTAYVGGYLRAASEAYLLTLVGSASARNDEYYLFNTGSILASLGNVTGAIHYYQESLARKKDFEAAQKSLTEVACLIRQRSVFSKTASKGMSVEVFEEGEDPTCHLMIHPEAPDTVVVCSLVDCQTEGPCGTAEYVVCISVHRNRTGGWAVTSKDVERAAELNLTHCSFEPHQSDDSIRSLQQVLASQDFLKSVSLVEDVPVENVLEETSSSSEASVAPQRIQVKLVLQEPSTKETQSVEKSNKNLISGKVRITSTPSSGPLDRRPACRDDDVLPEALFSLPADLRRNEMVLTPDLTILAECSALVESTKGEPVVRFPPTWLSFSSKGIDITSIIPGYPKGPAPVLNVECPSQPPSMRTWDHLSGVARREELLSRNSPETALLDSLLSFMPEYALDARDVGLGLSQALIHNSDDWVVSTAASLYWRVVGDHVKAVDCLRHALHRAPRHAMDVPLVSLANVMGRAGLLNDALILAHAALEISPRYISVHLTIANFYALKRDLENAALFYRSALQLQSQFQPAKERLFKVECLMLHDQGLL